MRSSSSIAPFGNQDNLQHIKLPVNVRSCFMGAITDVFFRPVTRLENMKIADSLQLKTIYNKLAQTYQIDNVDFFFWCRTQINTLSVCASFTRQPPRLDRSETHFTAGHPFRLKRKTIIAYCKLQGSNSPDERLFSVLVPQPLR